MSHNNDLLEILDFNRGDIISYTECNIIDTLHKYKKNRKISIQTE